MHRTRIRGGSSRTVYCGGEKRNRLLNPSLSEAKMEEDLKNRDWRR